MTAPNTSPVFSLTPNNGRVAVTAANTKSDGTGTIGTDIFKLFTAGAQGSWVSKIRLTTGATAAATTTTATVARIFLSTVTSGATTGGTDTFLLAEIVVPSVSGDSSTVPTNIIEVPLNIALKSGETILVTNHAAPAASTVQHAHCIGGDY